MRDLQNRSNNSGTNNSPQPQSQNNATETKRPKALYEGTGTGNSSPASAGQNANSNTPFTGSFRTHDDSQSSMGGNLMQNPNSSVQRLENSAASQSETRPEPRQSKSQSQNKDSQTQATLKACDEMEMRRDFQGAANLLKEALNNNLQNADIHHRLGLTLLNSGQLAESVSELRIASALNPSNKVFSADLARALNIHKRSMTAEPVASPAGGAGQ
jgi:tetratricopeptide (TPR) repeat protein